MFNFLQHPPLIVGMLHLLHFHHLLLFENFDGVEPVIVFGLHEMHPSKTARPKCSLDDKVRQQILSFRGPYRCRRRAHPVQQPLGDGTMTMTAHLGLWFPVDW